MDYAKESLKKHAEWKGKIEVVATVPVETKDDLSLAYTPGVAQPCLEIQKDVDKSYELTRRHNLCAVITDGTAVLGLGDIGMHFPDTDPKYKGISSILLLEKVGELLYDNLFVIENIDATIIAQAPKMRPHIDEMRANMAKALSIDISQINVKATTEEGLGFTGEGAGISAQAICLLNSPRELASQDVTSQRCMGCNGCTKA